MGTIRKMETGPSPAGGPADGRAASVPGIVFERVTLGYDGRAVLRDAELTLPAAAVTALIGPNGSGKSTMLSAMAGLRRPLAGRVLVHGQPPDHDCRRTAIVLQSTAVSPHLPVTVREVVTMGRYAARGLFGRLGPADRRAVDEAMDRLGVADLARRQVQQLSGGQRQRVFVAQGLAQEADVVLLDEPVSGLDAVSEERILAVIADEASAGHTVVVSTHDLAGASSADHLVLLAGRIVASGSSDVVLTEEHLTAAYGGRLVRLASGRVLVDDGSHHHHEDGHQHHDHEPVPDGSAGLVGD